MADRSDPLLSKFVTPAYDLFLDIFCEKVTESRPDLNFTVIEVLRTYFGRFMRHRISKSKFISKCQETMETDAVANFFINLIETSWTERLPDPSNINKKSENTLWSPEEDRLLLAAIYTYGIKSWAALSRRVGNGRTRTDVYHRWHRVLNPKIKKTPWTALEDDKLNYLVDKYGMFWSKIAKEMGDRSDFQCRYRYKSAGSRTSSVMKEMLSQISQMGTPASSQVIT